MITHSRKHDAVAKVMQAVAQPVRLALLEALSQGEQSVCNLARAVGAERSNVSRHLSVLANAGVIESRKRGLLVLYHLRTPCIMNVFTCVQGVLAADSRTTPASSGRTEPCTPTEAS